MTDTPKPRTGEPTPERPWGCLPKSLWVALTGIGTALRTLEKAHLAALEADAENDPPTPPVGETGPGLDFLNPHRHERMMPGSLSCGCCEVCGCYCGHEKQAAAYQRGAEDMRERAARAVEEQSAVAIGTRMETQRHFRTRAAAAIRALPLSPNAPAQEPHKFKRQPSVGCDSDCYRSHPCVCGDPDCRPGKEKP